MGSPLRLVIHTVLGTILGAILLSPVLRWHFYGFRSGPAGYMLGGGEQCAFAGAVLGAQAGILIFAVRRWAESRMWRFTAKEALLATALFAAMLSVTVPLLRWVGTL